MKIKVIVTAFAATSLFATANAMNAYEAFMLNTQDRTSFSKRELCDTLAGSKTAEEIGTCRARTVQEIKDRYAAAVKTIKKSGEKAAFKTYHIARLTQIKALEVNSGESVGAYNLRQATAKGRTEEAWTAFEVEAGL